MYQVDDLVTGRIVSELACVAEQTLNGNGITVAVEALGANTRIPAAVTGWHRTFSEQPRVLEADRCLDAATPLNRHGLDVNPRDPARGTT